jgi:DNA invertase Pin-like site-specific DNA recombinase
LFGARDFNVATADDIGGVCISLDIRTISLMLILRDLFCADVKCRNGAGIMRLLGYARVSTDGQSLTAQVAELKAAGCVEIFQEKISGARTDRTQLARLMDGLRPDDVLVVTRLDRLARSTRDLLNCLAAAGDRGAGFKSLRDTWADTTTTPHGRLMLTVLGGLAEFERELIRSRTGEGRERAKARGVAFGRKPKLTNHERSEAIARRDAGESLVAIARSFNVSHSTISRLQ